MPRHLRPRFEEVRRNHENIDGVVAVTHTEGGESTTPNNLEMLLRTLAGFAIHPNIGAILAVDYGSEVVTNQMLRGYMAENNYPLEAVLHRFLSIQGGFDASLDAGETIIKGWLEQVNRMARTEESLSNLKIALQCGGIRRIFRRIGQPASGLRCERGYPLRRCRQSRRN